MNQHEVLKLYDYFSEKARNVFIEKNKVYDSGFLEEGSVGIVEALKHQIEDIETEEPKETDLEHFLDIANFGIMGAICERSNEKTNDK
jgi:hypothetical protein